jgi:hypothetical protein
MVSYGHQIYQIDRLSPPNIWINESDQQVDHAYPTHVQLQELMHMG